MRVDKKIYILLLNFIEECHMKIMIDELWLWGCFIAVGVESVSRNKWIFYYLHLHSICSLDIYLPTTLCVNQCKTPCVKSWFALSAARRKFREDGIWYRGGEIILTQSPSFSSPSHHQRPCLLCQSLTQHNFLGGSKLNAEVSFWSLCTWFWGRGALLLHSQFRR